MKNDERTDKKPAPNFRGNSKKERTTNGGNFPAE